MRTSIAKWLFLGTALAILKLPGFLEFRDRWAATELEKTGTDYSGQISMEPITVFDLSN